MGKFTQCQVWTIMDKFTINCNELDMGKFTQCQVWTIMDKFTINWNELDMDKFTQCQVWTIMDKFTYWGNILGTIQIWVNSLGPQMINLPLTRMNLIWVNLPSVKSELSWVNLPAAGTFWEQSRFGYIYLVPRWPIYHHLKWTWYG